MPANLENSTVATGLEKVSFHSNPKERQCQRMLKLPHNCTHLTRQNSPSQASAICELWTSRCSSALEKAEEPEIKLPRSVGLSEKQEDSRKTSTSALLTMPKPLAVWITTDWFQIGKGVCQAVYCHPAYLTYMQSTSWEILDWMNTSWNQDFWEKYQQPQICW